MTEGSTRDVDEVAVEDEPRSFAELVKELRYLCTSFGDMRPADMTAFFYIRAFNEYDIWARAMLECLDNLIRESAGGAAQSGEAASREPRGRRR